MMKQCTNVSCGYENPDEARFCKKCGTPISNSVTDRFTLDTFEGIQFLPVSVVKVSFINNFLIVLWVLFFRVSYTCLYYNRKVHIT